VAGYDHCLALRSDGRIAAWGVNSHGQLDVPDGLSNVVALAAGSAYSIALKQDGSSTGGMPPATVIPGRDPT
jgi:alpha-tubulin suppressor-like RCC1 family protein